MERQYLSPAIASESERRQPGLELLCRLREPAARGIDEVHMLALLQAEHQAGHQGGAGAVQAVDQPPLAVLVLQPRLPLAASRFADGGYAGPKLRGKLAKIGDWTMKIVKRFDTAKGFEVIPRRWVVERTPGQALRMAEPMPEIGERLGKDHRQRRGVDPHRPHPPRQPTPRKVLLCHVEFRVGHSGADDHCVLWKGLLVAKSSGA